MTDAMLIRRAQGDDLAPLREFVEAQPLGTGWTPDSLADTLQNPQDSIWLGFDQVSRLQAILITRVVAGEAELLNIVVAEGMRRKGWGRALVGEWVASMKKELVKRLFLEVRVSNLPAITLYENFGFSEVGRRARYYQPDQEDALVLARSL